MAEEDDANVGVIFTFYECVNSECTSNGVDDCFVRSCNYGCVACYYYLLAY